MILNQMQRHVLSEYDKLEDEILTKILTQHLGRTPLPRDWRKCTIYTIVGVDNKFCIAYQNWKLGMVTVQMIDKRIELTFEPLKWISK